MNRLYIILLLIFNHHISFSQEKLHFLAIPDTLHKARFWGLTGTATLAYSGTLIYLDQIWYAQYPRSSFHTFNDFGEWLDMDKAGHSYTAYLYSYWAARAYRWTGMKPRQAAWTSAGMSMLFQTTLEVLDGYSTEWGFSWGDMAFNTGGTALFLGQELAWGEQRVLMKYSSFRQKIPNYTITSINGASTTLRDRTLELYGSSLPEVMVKDYNATTIWASVNIASFLKEESRFPKWLNVAVGYGAENMYGARSNTWKDKQDNEFVLSENIFPRQRQVFLSFDVDLTKIKTRSKLLKGVLTAVNVFKIPAPALEINTTGAVKFHALYF